MPIIDMKASLPKMAEHWSMKRILIKILAQASGQFALQLSVFKLDYR